MSGPGDALDVLVVGATDWECATAAIDLADRFEREVGGRPLAGGRAAGLVVGVLATGVGKANAAMAIGAALERLRVGLVLAAGVGGAYPGSGLRPGDLAVASEEVYGDEGAQGPEGFLDMESLGLPLWTSAQGPVYGRFPADPAAVEVLCAAASQAGRLARGPFVTVSTVTGTRARAEELEARHGALCENMEGAAVAHAAAVRGVPFGEVRGISNAVGPRDRDSWVLGPAAEAAGRAVGRFVGLWADAPRRTL